MVWKITRKDPHRVFVAGPAMEQEQESGRGMRTFSDAKSPVIELNQFGIRNGWHVFESNLKATGIERSSQWV
jgi:hypothetical protein